METPLTLTQTALLDLDHELGLTRRVLERAPDAHFGWRPHERANTLGELLNHLADLPGWAEKIVPHDFMDAADFPRPAPASTAAEVLAKYDAHAAACRRLVEEADDRTLREPWELRMHGRTLFRRPKFEHLRGMLLNHMIHHRAQATLYYRMLGVPVPSIYGPSGDEVLDFLKG